MNHAEWAQVGKGAQDGFTRLQQEIEARGASEPEALTILLGIAQLKVLAAGVVIESSNFPSPDNYPSPDNLPTPNEG